MKDASSASKAGGGSGSRSRFGSAFGSGGAFGDAALIKDVENESRRRGAVSEVVGEEELLKELRIVWTHLEEVGESRREKVEGAVVLGFR